MTAVAVLQEKSIRQWYKEVYWLTVGADAVEAQLRLLQGTFCTQLTGKSMSRDDTLAKSAPELQEMLVAAMATKQKALVVLDDPWTPEQVRGTQRPQL